MAFDGIVISNIVWELKEKLKDARITKIAQTESDKLLLTIKNTKILDDGKKNRTLDRLVISVNPSLPLIYLTEENEASPMQAPTFCMVLRKHLNNCKIVNIRQIDLERVICFDLEHLNEMGDFCKKRLYIELMGKHSNIIFCDENDVIVDSIKRISLMVSSVREVLPGRKYFIPGKDEKSNPLTITFDEFKNTVLKKKAPLSKAIYLTLTGFSPVMSNELLYRASLQSVESAEELSDDMKLHLFRNFSEMINEIKKNNFYPHIVYRDEMPVEFASLPLTNYRDNDKYKIKEYTSVSQMIFDYYHTKEILGRIHQKSSDLRRITKTALERSVKKYDLQIKQLKDTEKRDKYKVYGELLTTYGYSLNGGEKNITCDNFYTGEKITIPLDNTKSAVDNAKKYFDKYAKLKRTMEALTIQTKETKEEIDHLQSISNSLDIARSESDLSAIRRELEDTGYVKKQSGKNKNKRSEKSKPLHYISSDGFHMYVGKNNYQNEELTLKFATGNDWWFHAKESAGSHVIVKTEGKELPDKTFEEAARLAAFYSKASNQGKTEVDYIQKKHIKKPNGSKPGYVIYHTNYSMTIETDITGIKEIND